MMDVQELVGLFANQPLALLPERLSILRRILRDPESVGEQEMQAAFGAAKRPKADNGGGIAIIPIMGTIVPRASALAEQRGFVSAERIGREIAAAVEDESIRHIVLHMDTPGGNVAGVPELARQVFEARRVKPVTAVADSLMASAG